MIEPCEEIKRVEQRYEKALDDMEKHYKDVLEQIRDEIKHEFHIRQSEYTELCYAVMGVIDRYTKGEQG